MDKILKRIYNGDFRMMRQEQQEDGSIIVILLCHNDPKIYRIHVKDLYGENEEVLESETIAVETPKHIRDRQQEAKKDADADKPNAQTNL